MTSTEFYNTQVFDADVDLSVIPGDEERLPPHSGVASVLIRVAAVAVVGVLTLTVASSSMNTPTAGTWYDAAVGSVVERVPIPDVHRAAAAQFKNAFRAVPLNDVERLPDPDYGL